MRRYNSGIVPILTLRWTYILEQFTYISFTCTRQIKSSQHLSPHYIARPLGPHYIARPLGLHYNHYVSASICVWSGSENAWVVHITVVVYMY